MLKQKKLLEGQRDQLYNQQFNMEQTSFALESMKDSVAQVKAMKAANKELKQAFGQKELNISAIDKLHDEMADMMVSPQVPRDRAFGSCLVFEQAWNNKILLVPDMCLQFHDTTCQSEASMQSVCHMSNSRCPLLSFQDHGSKPGLMAFVLPCLLLQMRVSAVLLAVKTIPCLQDMHNEIQDVLGQSFGIPDEIDEDDLMGELDALEDEMASELESGTRSGVPSYLQVSFTFIPPPQFLHNCCS